MRRHLMTLALAALLGSSLLAADASACCHKKRACAQPVQTCAVVAEPAPCPPPAGCCGHKKFKLFGGGLCHKKAAPVCAPVAYAAPVEVAPSAQASAQQ